MGVRACACACAHLLLFLSATFTEEKRKNNAKIINKTKKIHGPDIVRLFFSFCSVLPNNKTHKYSIASDFLIWSFLISIFEKEIIINSLLLFFLFVSAFKRQQF